MLFYFSSNFEFERNCFIWERQGGGLEAAPQRGSSSAARVFPSQQQEGQMRRVRQFF